MNNRTLVVDSPYLLKRSIEGAKDLYTNKFGHIGGLYQFFTTLRKLIRDHKINKVVLAWDGENSGIERYLIDRSYKANRSSKSWFEPIQLTENEIRNEKRKRESTLKQKKRIQSYAEELFIRQIEVNKIEADDLIAKYCEIYHNIEDIYVYTNDRDIAQCFNYDISIIFGNIDVPVNKDNFMYYFEYYYKNVLTVKIITGDVSDNIKGIDDVKLKTLKKYFPELDYKPVTVRDICKNAKKINEERVKNKKKPLKALENIISNIDRLKINHKLMDLSNPILNDEAIEELNQLDLPLSPEDRSSKNLYRMMNEDEFFTVYKGTFANYVEPFYTVISNEKRLLNDFYKNQK